MYASAWFTATCVLSILHDFEVINKKVSDVYHSKLADPLKSPYRAHIQIFFWLIELIKRKKLCVCSAKKNTTKLEIFEK